MTENPNSYLKKQQQPTKKKITDQTIKKNYIKTYLLYAKNMN